MCTSKWTDGVDFEGAEVVATRPDFFDESETDFARSGRYLLADPQVQLATEVEHEHLHRIIKH